MCDEERIWSVSEITAQIKETLADDPLLRDFRVRGEITKLTRQNGRRPGSQYLYFTIKDEVCPLSCAMFSGVRDLDFEPESGGSVVCEGYIEVYEPQGRYQMICTDMYEDGEGAAAAALERLRVKLEAEGVFSNERPIPQFPRKIAVVTSPTGSVIHDIIETTSIRYPLTTICVIPSLVQGDAAAASLVSGMKKAQDIGADVIIIGRGGGSKEDLACFNSEALARAIHASGIPVISAVGHETDVTLSDYAADRRASTPTQAAELAVPDIRNIRSEITGCVRLAGAAFGRVLSDAAGELSLLEKDIRLNSPRGRLLTREAELQRCTDAISNNIRRRIADAECELAVLEQSVSKMNPMNVLCRGYSVTKLGDKVITSADDVTVGDVISVTLANGTVTATVTDKTV